MADVGRGAGRGAAQRTTAPATSAGPKAAAKLERQAQSHERGEPCGRGDCALGICQAARREMIRARAANKAKVRDYWHSFGKPCGQGDCKAEICRKALQTTSKGKRKSEPGRASPQRPPALASEERRRREAHSRSLPCGVPGCAESSCQGSSPQNKKAPAAAPASKVARPQRAQSTSKTSVKPAATGKKSPRGTMTCRECLRTKPLGAFPNPKVRRCEACGGQESSTSVRTVSGGAPGLGRRR